MKIEHIPRQHILCYGDMLKIIPLCDEYLSKENFIIKAKIGKEHFYNESLFLRGFEHNEQERFILERFGHLRSLSGLSLLIMQGFFKDFPCKWHLHDEKMRLCDNLILAGREFVRPGIYQDMIIYDRNSAHVACCIDFPLPQSHALRHEISPNIPQFIKALPFLHGMCRAKILCIKDIPIGILPIKGEHGIEYPNCKGDLLEGFWTLNELKYALESGAYAIQKLYYSLTTIHTKKFLHGFAEYVWNERSKSPPKSLPEKFWKMIGNRGIGRLGMKGSGIRLLIPSSKGEKGAIFFQGRYFAEKQQTYKPLSNRLWSAYVFAEQRIEQHKALSKAVNPVYGFTDSIICESLHGFPLGQGLGQYKMEYVGQTHVLGLGQYYTAQGRQAHRGVPAYQFVPGDEKILGQGIEYHFPKIRKEAFDD